MAKRGPNYWETFGEFKPDLKDRKTLLRHGIQDKERTIAYQEIQLTNSQDLLASIDIASGLQYNTHHYFSPWHIEQLRRQIHEANSIMSLARDDVTKMQTELDRLLGLGGKGRY
jgi:hypothetical protein